MTGSDGRTKVAVLGAGPAGMAAAYELSATPELRERYEVTVYQMGWRVGGKCASGRNRDHHDRIEEHGLHVWFGFYDNAFTLMQRVYGDLGRPADAPLATWDEAFKPSGEVIVYEHYDERWIPRVLRFPDNPFTPGDDCDHSPWDVLHNALAGVAGHWAQLVEDVGIPLAHPVVALLDRAVGLVAGVIDDDRAGDAKHLSLVGGLVDKCRDLLWELVVKHEVDHDGLRHGFMLLDFAATVIVGVAEDRLLERGWSVANDEDLRDWMRRHGAKDVTLEHSPFVIGIYDGAFAYVDGDKDKPELAAGKAIQDFIRALFFYQGSFLWKMQAGMGDTVFAPMYELMRQRGVRFRFFHEVRNLGLSDDGGAIATIEMLEQLEVKDDAEYEPLYDVGGLPCWPTAPDWSQLVGGEALAAKGVKLEFERNPLDRKPHTLHRGRDFDEVVLAIPVQVHPEICSELIAADDGYRAMVEHQSCVMTQAIQTWANTDLPALGWPFAQNMLMSTYVEPLDTYCNMSHLIPRERWKDGQVRDIAYFCGCLPHAGLDTQDAADARVLANAQEFLERDVDTLWPKCGGADGAPFDYELLVAPNGAKGTARLEDQFWRANWELTERYVLTRPGSLQHRRWPHDSGFANLVLCGDWTRCGIDGGSVESSVTSGMLAAQAITGEQLVIHGLHGWLYDTDPRHPGDTAAPGTRREAAPS